MTAADSGHDATRSTTERGIDAERGGGIRSGGDVEGAPRRDDESIEQALTDTVYRDAYNKVQAGTDAALLSEDERQALQRAREMTGITGPGYPPPRRKDG